MSSFFGKNQSLVSGNESKDDVNLHNCKGCNLRASRNLNDYQGVVDINLICALMEISFLYHVVVMDTE